VPGQTCDQKVRVNILGVSSEMAPYAKTGGLADVLGALPRYLRRSGHDVRVFVPLYDRIDTRSLKLEPAIADLDVRLGVHRYRCRILQDSANPSAWFVDCPELYHRGAIYTHEADEHRRFVALNWAALMACQRLGFAPDVVHCNDWQTGMLPLILKVHFGWDALFARTRTLLTIHNLNYQGGFSSSILPDLNLNGSEHLLHQDLLRQGRINFLLQGILYADGISTVSPTYAREIQTEEHGAGLDGFLRARRSSVVGILNGVDYDEWSPETDRYIPSRYSRDDLSGKAQNKEAMLGQFGLPHVPGVPVIGIVSRLVGQKGFDLIPEVLPALLERRDLQLVVLGSGEARLEEMFMRLRGAYPRQVAFHRGFSNPLAHLIEAGSDMFLMPSRYEPCGLNQMYSLRYGTVPIVHRTGGLADTVHLWNPRTGVGTGFPFEHHDAGGLRWGVETAMRIYRDASQWSRLMLNGMEQDFSWTAQSRLYELLYTRLGA
jgi:starch synthase